MRYRWPKAECLHQNTETFELRQGWDRLLHTRERCLDCGAKRTPEGWT